MSQPKLKRTSEVTLPTLTVDGKQKLVSHYHIVFCDKDAGTAQCAPAEDGHIHEVVYQPPQPPQQDPQTGQVISPAKPGYYVVVPAQDMSGLEHDHTLETYSPEVPKKQKDHEIVKEVYHLFKVAYELAKDSIQEGRDCEEYVRGNQWSEEDKQYLADLDRAAITMNLTEKQVDDLVGYQRQQRYDLRYLPMEGGDQRAADILNILSKNVCEQNMFTMEESEVFENQVIAGRGAFDVWVDFDEDIRGEIKIESFPWDEFLLGPHNKKNCKDLEYFIKHKMFSLQKIKQKWPDAIKEDGFNVNSPNDLELDSTSSIQHAIDNYIFGPENSSAAPRMIGDIQMVDEERKDIRVIECQRLTYEKGYVAIHPEKDLVFPLRGWKRKDALAVTMLNGFELIQKTIKRVRITKVCGAIVLSDENPANLPVDEFFFVPVYAKYKRGRFWGKVARARDAQDEINKRHSQAIDIGNKMAAYSYFGDPSTFVDENEENRFKKNSTSPGGYYKVNNVNNIPRTSEGIKFPSELVQLLQLGDSRLRDLMNIVAEPTGANQSAAHLQHVQRMRIIGNEFLFDNLAFGKRTIGRLLVPLFQRYYTPDRVIRIIENSNTQQNPAFIGNAPYDSEREAEIRELWETTDLAKVDVIVSQSSHSPTARLAVSMIISEMMQSGAPIPPQVYFEFADIPDDTKRKISQMFEQQQQAQAQAEQQKAQSEIQKTMIAHQPQGQQMPNGNGR